jgi:hypothetical protein
VAFVADDLEVYPLDSNGKRDVFVANVETGEIQLVSRRAGAHNSTNGHSSSPLVSSTGEYVLFYSDATNLHALDQNGESDVFLAAVTWDLPQLPGDYNLDGRVDAADYSVWRDALGATGLVPYNGADGDGDGTIDQDDYAVWKANFGRTLEAGSVELGPGSGKPGIEKLIESNLLLQGQVEELTAGQASSGTRAIRWEHELGSLGLEKMRGRTQRLPPAEPGAGGRVRVAVESRDLALLAWRAGLGRRGDERGLRVRDWELDRGGDAEDVAFEDVDAAIELLADGVPALITR